MSSHIDHEIADQEIPQESDEADQSPSFWRSRAGVYLIAALVFGAAVLGWEYRAYIFSSSLILWLPLLLCVGMHFFMHGGHGGHGGHGSGDDRQ